MDNFGDQYGTPGNKFTVKPTEGEQVASNTVKDDISAGAFNSSLFNAVAPLYPCLHLWNTNIPRSVHVEEATLDAFGDVQDGWPGEGESAELKWIKDTFEACNPGQVSKEKLVKDKFRDQFALRLGEVPPFMRDLGFSLDHSNGTDRYVKFEFVTGEGKKPVRIKA